MPNAAHRGKGNDGGTIRFGKGSGAPASGGVHSESVAGKGPAWDCSACGHRANFGWRSRCRLCEAPRTRDGVVGNSGSGSSSTGAGAAARAQTLAERQLQDIRNAQKHQRKADEAEKKRLRDELAKAQAELAAGKHHSKLSKAAAGSGPELEDDDDEGDEMEVSGNEYSSWTEEERQRQVELARAGVAYAVAKHGEESAEVQAIRDEISALQKASRDAKPFKAHRGLLERRRERIRAKLERDEAEVERIKTEQAALQAKLDGLNSSNEDKKRQLAEVEEELAELVRKALAEGDAAGAAGKQSDEAAAQWSAQSASSIIFALGSRPGIPPEFAALLGHVYQAAQALAGAETAAAAQAAPPPAAAGGTHRAHEQPSPKPQPQQQQPSPQHQQARMPSSTGAAEGVAVGGAAASSGTGGITSAEPPNNLAPQARWARNSSATGAGTGKGAVVPTTYAAAVAGGAAGGQGDQGGVSSGATDGDKEGTGQPGGATATNSDKGNNSAAADEDQELVEDEDDGMQVDSDVAASINKLPKADQVVLRAALRSRRNRNRDDDAAGGDGDRGRERERSPRPTKTSGGQEEP